jgi:hypothetical protein
MGPGPTYRFPDEHGKDQSSYQPAVQRLNLSIDDLEDRAAMLQDVRARISYLKRDLGALLASLRPSPMHRSHL